MSAFVSYLLAAYVLIIGICLLLSLVWLVLRVINAAVVLCHSACSFARSLVVMAFPAKPNSATIATAGTLPSPARLASPAEYASPAGERIAIVAGENADRVGNGSAQGRQHGSASKDHPDAAGEDAVFAGEDAVHIDEGSAMPLPASFSARSNECHQGSAQGRQHGSASKDHSDIAGEETAFTGEGSARADEGSAMLATQPSSMPPARVSRPRRRDPRKSGLANKRASKVRLTPRSKEVPTRRMTAAEIAVVIDAFRRWMGDWHMTGYRIAVADVWDEAQNFARAEGIELPKRDRFLEVLAMTPGIRREYDVRLDGERKVTVYTFSPPVQQTPPTVEFMNSEPAPLPC